MGAAAGPTTPSRRRGPGRRAPVGGCRCRPQPSVRRSRRAGKRKWPVLGSPRVTVVSAVTDAGSASPVSASTPEGMSTARTWRWWRRAFSSRTASKMERRGSSRGRARPVPRTASTTRPAELSDRRSRLPSGSSFESTTWAPASTVSARRRSGRRAVQRYRTDLRAPGLEVARRYEAVAAVVAGADEDEDIVADAHRAPGPGGH